MMKCIVLSFLALIMVSLPATAGNLEEKPFSEAAYTFGVEDIGYEDKTVSFTIPENARAIDEAADAVLLSGLYLNSLQPAAGEQCPVVSSYHVDKNIESYNMFTGRAKIIATFDDPDVAKAAYDKKCLLIDDPD